MKAANYPLQRADVSVQLLFGEHPFEKAADVEEGSVKRTLHRILKVNEARHLTTFFIRQQSCLCQAIGTSACLSSCHACPGGVQVACACLISLPRGHGPVAAHPC